MFIKINLIAQINDPDNLTNATCYFFSKKYKFLLPIEINLKKLTSNSLIDTLLKTLKYFEIKIKKILVYMYRDGIYYCYICFEKFDKPYEINCSFYDMLGICRSGKYPIYIRKSILNRCGIKISKKLLVKALEEDFYLPVGETR